jgi:hypothetical protein
MSRYLLAIIALVVCCPIWCSDPAIPAAKAEDYPVAAPAPGTSSPAADAGHAAAAAVATANKSPFADLGSVTLVAAVAALGVLEKAAPSLLARFLPMAGPYGGILQLILQGALWLLKPKAQKEAERLQADHAEGFRVLSTTIQTVSNAAPVASLKARLAAALSPELRAVFDAYVAELKASGIDHDTHGSGTLTDVAAKPAA